MESVNLLAWAIFVGYLVLIAVVSYFSSKRIRTVSDFISASGKLGFWMYCLLMVGSVLSGMTLIGVSGLGFTTGWSNVWERIIGPPFAIAFGTIIIGHKIFKLRNEKGILTMQDYLAYRYNDEKFIRLIAGIISALTCFIYMIAQYTAIGVVSVVVLGIPYWLGALIASIIVISYVMAGGMFSTAWTTFIQSLLMIIGVILTVPVIVMWIGGFDTLNYYLSMVPELQNATRGVSKSYLFAYYLDDPFAPANVPLAGWIYNMTLFGLTVPLGLMVAPHIVNNVLTFREIRYTKWSPLILYLLSLTVIMLTSIAGMCARVAWAMGKIDIPHLDLGGIKVAWSDMAYPTIAKIALPEFLFILILPTILAGVMSTTDRLLLTAASNIGYDIYKNVLKPNASDREIKIVSRLFVPIIGFLSLYIALNPQPLLAWFIWSALALMLNCFFFPIILGLYWKRMNKMSAILSMIGGFIVTCISFALYGKTIFINGIPLYSALPGFFASMICAIIPSILKR